MAVQLAFPVHAQSDRTLEHEVQSLSAVWTLRAGAPALVRASAAITRAHFAGWGSRILSKDECTRIEAYFRGVLRRRIIAGRDTDAREARRLLVARSIEQDLVDAGWGRDQAMRQAYDAAGIALSA